MPTVIDHDAPHAGALQRPNVPFDQRFAAHLEHDLGREVGERAHALGLRPAARIIARIARSVASARRAVVD
jgi:hypothetical protein